MLDAEKHNEPWPVEEEHKHTAGGISTRVVLPNGLHLYSWESVETVRRYLNPALAMLAAALAPPEEE